MYKCIVCVKKCTYICYIIYLYLSFETPQSCNRIWTMFQNRPLALQAIYPQKTMPVKTQRRLPHNINHLIFSSGKIMSLWSPATSSIAAWWAPATNLPGAPTAINSNATRPKAATLLCSARPARRQVSALVMFSTPATGVTPGAKGLR